MANLTSTDGNEYDPTNFAGVMRECFILLMNAIPEDKMTRDKAFWKAQKQLAPLRKAIEKFYRWQVDKFKGDSLPVWVFGVMALKELEKGTKLSTVKLMFSFAQAKTYEATMRNARALYAELSD